MSREAIEKWLSEKESGLELKEVEMEGDVTILIVSSNEYSRTTSAK